MERLTKRVNGVVVYVGTMNPYMNGQIPCEVESAGVREMMYRLAAYEDTGLMPEDVAVPQERTRWIPVEERLPEDGGDDVLAIVYGRPEQNIELIGSIQIAAYCNDDSSWFVSEYPCWENPRVTHWMPLPAGPEVE